MDGLTLGLTLGSLVWIWVALWELNRRTKLLNQLRFRLIFGMWPHGDSHEMQMIQEQLDRILKERAVEFLGECGVEEGITISYRVNTLNRDPVADRRAYQEQHRRVIKSKRAFRTALALADKMEYSIRRSAKDYLPADSGLQKVSEP